MLRRSIGRRHLGRRNFYYMKSLVSMWLANTPTWPLLISLETV